MLNLIVPSVAAIYAAWLNDTCITVESRQTTLAIRETRCHEDTHKSSITPENTGKLTENAKSKQADTQTSLTSAREISSSNSNNINTDKGNCLQPTHIHSSTYTISDANPDRTGMRTSIFSNWMLQSQPTSGNLAPNTDTHSNDSHKGNRPSMKSRQEHSLNQEDCLANAAAIGLFTSRTLWWSDRETANCHNRYFTNQLGNYPQEIPPYIALAASCGMATNNRNQLVNHAMRRETLGDGNTSPRWLTLSPPSDTGAPAHTPEEETTHPSQHRGRYRDETGTGPHR